ncbi:hypothetical protein HF234_003739 [Salmonella enterica]|nr:hypothetical protein [Salmonella enterica]
MTMKYVKAGVFLTCLVVSQWVMAQPDFPEENLTVNINVTALKQPCTFSVSSPEQTFTILRQDISTTKFISLPNKFTVVNCQGIPLGFMVTFSTPARSGTQSGPQGYTGLLCPDSGACSDPNSVMYHIITNDTSNISGGQYYGYGVAVPDASASQQMTVTPPTDNYSFEADTRLTNLVNAYIDNAASKISGSYIWAFSYP